MSTEVLTITPSRADWAQILNDETFTSVSGIVQTQGRVGNRWQLALTFSNLTGSDRRAVLGHAMQMRGAQNRLQVYMSTLGYERSGAGGGSPVTSNVLAGAYSIALNGTALSVTKWLVPGDFFTIGNELKIVTQQCDTAATGNASVTFWPELHKNYVSSTALNITAPYGVFLCREAVSFPITPGVSDWISDVVLSLMEDCAA